MRSLLVLLFAGFTLFVRGAEKPNILFILADDLSWSDLACYGHLYHETPNLDRLAKEGIRFTQAYAPAPICSASRAGILTGRTPARLHFEFVTKDKPGSQNLKQLLQAPPYTMDLPLKEVSMAEVLAPAGYYPAFYGKWHLNQHYGGYLGWSPTHGPLQQGFKEGSSDFGSHPYAYLKKEGRAFLELPAGEFAPDTLTDKAVAFIRKKHTQPFFLYLSHYYVHDPVHTRCRWLFDKYRHKLSADFSDTRVAYAAMVETLDYQIGRVLTALAESGQAKNTLVVFMSDNGGNPNSTSNAPLRGNKWNLYEGGIRVPFMVRWPGHVPASKTCDQIIYGCDLLPTFADVAGAKEALNDGVTRDGISLLDLWLDPFKKLPDRSILWNFPYYHPEKKFDKAPAHIGINDGVTTQTRPQSCLRYGHYKLIHFDEDNRDELYDVSADLGEQHDLSSEHPALAAQMRQRLDAALQSNNARRAVRSGIPKN